MASAAKKASRSTNEGAVGTYIHAGGKIGVPGGAELRVRLRALTQDFQELLRDMRHAHRRHRSALCGPRKTR